MNTSEKLKALKIELERAEKQYEQARLNLRAFINNNNLNKKNQWPPEDRIDVIGQNGNNGEHYES